MLVSTLKGALNEYIVPFRATVWKNGRCTSKRRLDGMVSIVTGANTGLGKETAMDLAKRGTIHPNSV